ncbi:NADH:ubiquinone reductase (Na(+)-transporting) subunit F [Aliikangiella sp. IMCC44632]
MKLANYIRKYHKWLALIVGLQALLWCLTGLYMTAVQIQIIHGDHLVKPFPNKQLSSFRIKSLDSATLNDVAQEASSIQLKVLFGQPVYIINNQQGVIRLSAESLERLPEIDEQQIRENAAAIYQGRGAIRSVQRLSAYPKELGGLKKEIWQVSYDDWLNSTLYFTPDTGSLRSKRSDLWRLFDFFWMLHIMDYDTRENINNNLLRLASTIGLLLTLSGVGLLVYSFRQAQPASSNLVSKLKKLHKWIALIIGIQLVLWMFTGMMFSFLQHDDVKGKKLINKQAKHSETVTSLAYSKIAKRYPELTAVQTLSLLGKAVFAVSSETDRWLIDTKNLDHISITENKAKQIAAQIYAVDGEVVAINKETQRTTENRKFSLPVWRVDYSDVENSSIYIDAKTGRFYGLKTDTWRLFDIFWMLHIMDYSERSDMNNSLVIFSVALSSFIAVTGLLILFKVFHLSDFNLFARFKRSAVVIRGPGAFTIETSAPKFSNLFDFLAKQGYQLPSTCGGGGSCGLCKVTLDPSAAASESDKAMLTQQEIQQGVRLACQHRLTNGVQVTLPDSVATQQLLNCKVISNEFKTPLIKELVVAMPNDTDFTFQAGEYVLMHFKKGVSALNNQKVPEKFQAFWDINKLYQLSSSRSESISRAYSMANPPTENDRLVFNIRLALPLEGNISGEGSTAAFNLKQGDEVMLSGPFGQFHAKDNDKEIIFIGGGAGLAPLRSHILTQLKTLRTNKKLSLWFGARNELEIFYAEEFEQLVKEHSNFSWHVALSHLPKNHSWNGSTGYIHQVIYDQYLSQHHSIADCEFYICGPQVMNEAVKRLLLSLGVEPSAINIDDFGA